jgi:GNAT superfamily N-acetyltransferase
MLETTNHQLKSIKYGSPEYYQAARLRYRLFYQEHGIPFEVIFDPQEEQDLHFVITAHPDNHVLAYSRLRLKSRELFQIYQMVVEPEYQAQGLGTRLLKVLIEAASHQGAGLLVLDARLAQARF